jgi:2-amino-4-hydroxy-6-hydroxymethyldihydropteridine diphosphokinase
MPTSRKESDTSVVVGLGANLGSPRRQLVCSVEALKLLSSKPVRVAGLYRSRALGPEQPDFLNSAATVHWDRPLVELLERLHEVEFRFGRERNLRWGPRTLDLDILWAGRRRESSDRLVVPHRELSRRAFALRPLLDLFPSAVEPPAGPAYAGFLDQVRSQRIERISGPEWAGETLPT